MTFPQTIGWFIGEATRFISPEGIAAEWVLVFIAAFLIATAALIPRRICLPIQNLLRPLAQRKMAAVLFCGALPVVLRISLLGIAPVPQPSIHDEFSHLLLGDTLVHGRMANPTHPMWRHFESIHVIQKPTYASMYPPGQGLFLAFGQKFFRHPWAGVVISVGLMYAAMCWMMQQWLPSRWAFLGTLLAILKFGITGFWMNGYLGGSVPAIGGALLIGSLPALRQQNIWRRHAVAFGAGLVVLMMTRPFEGALLGLSALIYLLYRLTPRIFREPKQMAAKLWPAVVILLCGAAFTGYYCWRVTGNPMRLPYQVNRDTYGWPENLSFLPPKKLTIQDKVLRSMYLKEVQHHNIFESPIAYGDNTVTKLFDNWAFLIGPVLTVPLLFFALIARNRRTRPLIVFLCIVAVLNLFQMVLYPYHLGPVVPIIFTVIAVGVRYMYAGIRRLNRQSALAFMAALPVCLVLVAAMKHETAEIGVPLSSYWERGYEFHRDARASIAAWLKPRLRKQLVIVFYAPNHPVDQEWVYNGADIDQSKIVWARSVSVKSDRALARYFCDREIWLLQADNYPQQLVPYSVLNSVSCPPKPVK